jgi:sporulation protein YlmC with PRC-barrel domain
MKGIVTTLERSHLVPVGIVCAAALAGAVLMSAGTGPVLSQGVELVTVDVAVVGQGYRASKLMGKSVTNEKNEKIGTLDDLIIGHDKSLFAVLQVGGFLGLGSHLVAIPYDSFKINETGSRVELPGASQEQLKKLTEFKYLT